MTATTTSRSRKALVVILGLLLLVLGAVAGWIVGKEGGDRATATRTRRLMAHHYDAMFHSRQSWPYGPPVPNADGSIPRPQSDAEAVRRQADDLVFKSQATTDEAIVAFDKAIAVDTRSASAYAMRAYLYSEKKDYRKAVADYTEAIRLGDNALLISRGDLHMRLGEYDKAIADYTSAIEFAVWRRSSPIEAYTRRGIAYTVKGKPQCGWDDFARVSQLESENER